jgi:hypothetical protein
MPCASGFGASSVHGTLNHLLFSIARGWGASPAALPDRADAVDLQDAFEKLRGTRGLDHELIT